LAELADFADFVVFEDLAVEMGNEGYETAR
jgi:hypothetical protein